MIVEVTLFTEKSSKFVSVEVPDDLVSADAATQTEAMKAVGTPVVEAYRELTGA